MKKTLTVNLGGTVFHIDEDAYQLLDKYLSNLRIHFQKEEGSEEIMDDFEMRISELFNERIRLGYEVITIEHVYCFPQCFAAVADRIGNLHGRYVVADIGSWTKDIICIDEKKVQPDKCVTVPNSIITLFQEINAAVAETTGGRIPESVVQNFILGKDVVIPEDVKEIIVSKLKAFATDIEGMLDESGFDLAYSNILYVGGGATIMRRFGNARENSAYLEDIRLNAKGYELLATHQMNKR